MADTTTPDGEQDPRTTGQNKEAVLFDEQTVLSREFTGSDGEEEAGLGGAPARADDSGLENLQGQTGSVSRRDQPPTEEGAVRDEGLAVPQQTSETGLAVSPADTGSAGVQSPASPVSQPLGDAGTGASPLGAGAGTGAAAPPPQAASAAPVAVTPAGAGQGSDPAAPATTTNAPEPAPEVPTESVASAPAPAAEPPSAGAEMDPLPQGDAPDLPENSAPTEGDQETAPSSPEPVVDAENTTAEPAATGTGQNPGNAKPVGNAPTDGERGTEPSGQTEAAGPTDRGGPKGNNGFGNGDQEAPGNSGPNNNAENAGTDDPFVADSSQDMFIFGDGSQAAQGGWTEVIEIDMDGLGGADTHSAWTQDVEQAPLPQGAGHGKGGGKGQADTDADDGQGHGGGKGHDDVDFDAGDTLGW